MTSIILLSGGLDSTVSFKKALDETEIALALTFDYGQRSVKTEIESAKKICKRYKVAHKTIELDWLKKITKTALVNKDKKIPSLRPEELDDFVHAKETAKAVWVPNRNGAFINIAASFAEAIECDYIVTGFNAEEAQTFPDNSPAFVRTINASLGLSTLTHPVVISYTQELTKPEIVKLGLNINAPLDLIWSCYLAQKNMCGKCESCLRAKRAFKEAGEWNIIRERFGEN